MRRIQTRQILRTARVRGTVTAQYIQNPGATATLLGLEVELLEKLNIDMLNMDFDMLAWLRLELGGGSLLR